MPKIKPAKRQVRLAIASNAGGSGKTTLAVHLAYAVANAGYKVVILELDANNSLRVFLKLEATMENSIAAVLKKDFAGNYPLTQLWEKNCPNASAIAGGQPLEEITPEINSYNRREYVLKDRLEDYPLDADLIIFDTPATLEPMGLLALVAATHAIVPIKPEYKDVGSFANLLRWYDGKVSDLRLKPAPELIGFVPCRADFSQSTHRNILGCDRSGKERPDLKESSLSAQCLELGVKAFPPIKESGDLLSATREGLPVQLYRPGKSAAKSFDAIAYSLIEIITK